MDLKLADTLVAIAGATGGIGTALVSLLKREHARMLFVGGRAEGLKNLVGNLDDSSIVDVIPGDFRKASDRKQCAEALSQTPAISGFVFLSAELRTDPIWTARINEFQETLDVNLSAALELAQPILAHEETSLVFVSSIDAHRHPTHASSAAYDSSKRAIESLSESIAAECGPRKVRSNCIVPGLIRTPMTEDFFSSCFDRERLRFLSAVPLARPGTAEEVADLIAFLLSPRSSYITGTTIPIDGGFLCCGI